MPYPGGHADGLAFSSGNGKLPYSLDIIFDELKSEGYERPKGVSLEGWARQGVLLLNTHLTTVLNNVNAHDRLGWDKFTGDVLNHTIVNDPVYLIWGLPAKLVAGKHLLPASRVLFAPHPAAERFGYKFIGCNHFKDTNRILEEQNKTPIQWNKD